MKILMSLIICSSVAGECMPPYPWPDTFRTQYDCLHFGYEESKRKLEEIGREDINNTVCILSLLAGLTTRFDNVARLW